MFDDGYNNNNIFAFYNNVQAELHLGTVTNMILLQYIQWISNLVCGVSYHFL